MVGSNNTINGSIDSHNPSRFVTRVNSTTRSNASSASSYHEPSDLSAVDMASDGDDIMQLNCVDSMFVDSDPLLSTSGPPLAFPPHPHSPSTPDDTIPAPLLKPLKRKKVLARNRSLSDSTDSDSNEFRAQAQRYRRLNHSGAKANSSWAHHKALKFDAQAPEFKHNDARLANFQAKITRDDPHAEFDQNDLRRVRCSACAAWIIMRALYEVRRWKEHRNSSKCQSQQQLGLVNKSIRNFFSSPAATALSDICKRPCPGLERERNPRISRYLRRSMAGGGGAPSRTNIAEVLFGVGAVYALLPEADKKMVLWREDGLFQWRNSRAVGAVFSTKCHKEVAGRQEDGQLPCPECRDLLRLHTFQMALNRPVPADANMKYTPINRRDPEIGNIYLKVKGVRDLVETVCLIFFEDQQILIVSFCAL